MAIERDHPLSDEDAAPLRSWFLVITGYLLATVVTTWPLVARLGTGTIPGRAGDQAQYMWNVDTFWTNVLAGRNPFFTTRVLYPIGANLMHTGFAPFVSLFGWPFLGDLPLFISVITLASFPAAALGMCLAVRALTGRFPAAVVAGLLYGFGPGMVSFAESSHTYKVVAAALLPYGLFATTRFLARGRTSAVVGLSIVTWALLFTDYYLLVVHLISTAILGLVCVRWRHLPAVGIAFTANLLLAFALIHWVLPPLDPNDLIPGGESFTAHANANLADYLVPRAQNLVLGRFAVHASDRPNGDIDYFLGWGIVALAARGAWRERKRPVIMALVGAASVLLALSTGTAVRFASAELLTQQWTPWYWLAQLPTLVYLDMPRCFSIGPVLAVSALAGIELAAWRRQRRAVLCGLALFALEYGQIGMLLGAIQTAPPIYERLAAARDTRTVLELPSGLTESKYGFGMNYSSIKNNPQMYWQTVYSKPRVGAYLSRIPQSTYRWFMDEPVIGDLFVLTTNNPQWTGRQLTALPDYSPEVVEHFIRTFNLGYVVMQPTPQQAGYARAVERLLAGHIAARETDETGYLLYTLDDRMPSAPAPVRIGGAPPAPQESR